MRELYDCVCEAVDYGFDLPDVRETFRLESADVEDEEEEEEEPVTVQVRVNRQWGAPCSDCGCETWRVSWNLVENGKVVATVPTHEAALAVIQVVYPGAKLYRDHDWESERHLRAAEGW